MKRIIPIFALFFFTCLFCNMESAAQRAILPGNLVGVDLKKAQQNYLKEIENGVDSMVVPYADALYHDGQITGAFMMYMRADSLGLPLSIVQQRNFEYAARRLNRKSPYGESTGYFSTAWQPQTSIQKFCVNSPQEDFAPYAWNELIFLTSSRHNESRRKQDTYRFTQLPFLSIHAFDKDCNAIYTDFLPENLNTSLHDGPLAIALDTSLVIITRNYIKPNQDVLQNLYLDFYTKNENGWNNETPFPYNDPSYSVQHPYYDDLTNTLYFSSDMPGGQGGFDLYKSSWDGESWSKPENLGPDINSPYDEVFPALSPEGHLFYGSNHIETTGGLDLVIFKDNQRHLLPKPFNTVYDDLTMTFINETSGYFASNRNQSVFNDDIYFFTITPTPFIVRVLDQATRMPLQGVRVGFQADTPPVSGQLITSAVGEGPVYTGYETAFPVSFTLAKEGYKTLETKTDAFVFEQNRWIITLEMEALPKELTIEDVIPEGYFVVYFDNDQPDPNSWSPTTEISYDQAYDDFKLRWPEFYENSISTTEQLDDFFEDAEKGMYQLEYLAGFLKEEFAQGRQYVIEFTSHASPLATNQYNLILSRRRFVAVENFLKSWDEGTLMSFINQHLLDYANNPFGSAMANPNVSGDPRDPARSIYSVEASRERRVTISWKRDVSQ
jgi:hypothetical protein